ncbi:MAG TPA: DUF484 family protein [Azospirillaceae bacterium]|nr:DUF484 family protein [Azospirillaceae bacterium]
MGRGTTTQSTLGDDLTAEDVAAYLREHPDFLLQHTELIPHLTPPMAEGHGGGVVDLQHFMLQKLRGEVGKLNEQQRELIATTRANLNNQNRVHAAALFLLDARSFEHLIQTISTDLAVLLDLDVACLLVESLPGEIAHAHHRTGVRVVEPGTIGRWMGKRDVLLRSHVQGMADIYGPAAGLVRSEALVRLRISGETPTGLLAFGSREPEMFHPGQGTELLCFLSRVVERCIRGWLDLPA